MPRADPLPQPTVARREPWLGVDRGGWLLFAAQGLTGLATAPFVVFGAIYQRQLGATALVIGLIGAVALILGTLSMIPGTRLAEEYYLRHTIVVGWALSVPAPLLYAVAPDWKLTALAGALLGVAVCNTPAINLYLTLGVPRDRISFVMTTVISAFSLGLIASTVASGWLAQMFGLRWLFAASFLLLMAATACVGLVPPKTLPPDAAVRVGYRDLLAFRGYLALTALFTAVTVIIFVPWTFTALYAREVAGSSDLSLGVLMGIFYLGSVLIGVWLSRFRLRVGPLPVVLVFEAAFIASAVIFLASRAFPILAVAFFLRGAFWSFRQVMTAVIGEALPSRALAKGYGLFALVTGVAAALASPIGGWLYGMAPQLPFQWSAGVMVAAMVFTVVAAPAFRPEAAAAPRQARPGEPSEIRAA